MLAVRPDTGIELGATLPMGPGFVLVPRYTVYDVAPEASPQSSVGDWLCPVAPFDGVSSEKLPGEPQAVVKLHVPLDGTRVVPPHEFVATTYQ